MRDKVLVVGSLNYDTILKIKKQPDLGETLPVDKVTFSAGGKGANQAVQAAKLGIETYMIGCVGNDYMGDYLISTAQKYGLHTDYIKRVNATTGMGIVNALEDGGVYACIVRGANYELKKEDLEQVSELLKTVGLIVLQMEIPADINKHVIDLAKENGCSVLLNAAPAEPFEYEYMRKCDIIVVNEVEAGFYAGYKIDSLEKASAYAEKMANEMSNTWIITMGKHGAVVSNGQKTEMVPSLKVDAIETTGAGDSFIGGISYAFIKNMNIFDACEFATKCSAVTVCRIGAQDSMPVLSEVMQ